MTIERSLARLLAAEFVGTFALVFAGCGAIMVDAQTGALGHVGVAISFGLVIMVMVYAVGHISGAHFNPAVTVAFALSRHFPRRRLLGYWAAQLLGALAAAAILRGSLGNVADVGAMLPSGSQGKPRQVTVRRGRPNGDRLRRLRAGQTPISAETRPEVAASWSAR
jgi:glycerol uptake facilitator-like aquaporin